MCEYCEPPYKNLVYLNIAELSVFVSKEGRIFLKHYDKEKDLTFAGISRVNYCPMCGHKLMEEVKK